MCDVIYSFDDRKFLLNLLIGVLSTCGRMIYVKSSKAIRGTAVVQWLRWRASNRKVAGSIPAGVILPIALRPWGRLSL